TYQDHDKPEKMYAEAGLDAASIVKVVTDAMPSEKTEATDNVVSVRRRPR
ncbi:deoxyxylulose-5-phosphate synthase, partial [Methylobacterium aerolatum]|nr:deoxyxylulose-5-phosphate synthase [Methylobacterium aerolatum]